MITIKLENLQFYSFHGIHDEERILGNNYEVNVVLSVNVDEQINNLEQTVNYVAVYEMIKQRMRIPTPLLETLAQDISKAIHNMLNRNLTISVSIIKINPPIPNMEGQVSVTYNTNY